MRTLLLVAVLVALLSINTAAYAGNAGRRSLTQVAETGTADVDMATVTTLSTASSEQARAAKSIRSLPAKPAALAIPSTDIPEDVPSFKLPPGITMANLRNQVGRGYIPGQLSAQSIQSRPYTSAVGWDGAWGSWGPIYFCNTGTWIVGWNTKVESYQGSGGSDDTAMNGIAIECRNKKGGGADRFTLPDAPFGGYWGEWMSTPDTCSTSNAFVTAIRGKMEPPQGSGDDTALNAIEGQCSSGQVVRSLNGQQWGDWMSWQSCPPSTAGCGMQVRYESYQYGSDDTGMNGVKMYCCSL